MLGCREPRTRASSGETLEHSGVLFPPEYTPHGVKMLYDGQPVELDPKQEEVHHH